MRRRIFLTVALALVMAGTAWTAPIAVGGIVRAADGTALAGARVELFGQPSNYAWVRRVLEGLPEGEPMATTMTDYSGRFSLPAGGTGLRTVMVRSAGYVPMRYSPLAVVRPIELPPVRLRPDAGIRIETVDAAGTPAAGVWVLAETATETVWSEWTTDGWRVAARIGRTDVHGTLSLPRASGEEVTIYAFPAASVLVSRVTAMDRATVVVGPTAAATQTIEVRSEKDEPLADIVVAVGTQAWPAGITDADGRLVLGGSPSGPLTLHLFAADGRRQGAELRPPAGNDSGPARFTLAPAIRVAGRVVAAADRRPLAEALVWPAHDPGRFVITGPQGRYEFVAPPGDRFWFQADAAGFLPRPGWVHQGASVGPTLRLSPAAVVTGQVIDLGGKPVVGVELEAVALTAAERPRSFRPDRADCRSVSNGDGRFTLLTLDPDLAYELRAARPGFLTARDTVSGLHRPAAREGLRIGLEPVRPAFGQVVDVDQRPVPGAAVKVLAAAPADHGTAPVSARTDTDGRFELTAVPAPQVDIEVEKKGFSPLTVRGIAVSPGAGTIDLGTLVIEPGIMIQGMVIDPTGEPIAGAGIRVAKDEDVPAGTLSERLRRREPDAVTGAAGRFVIGDLARDRKIHLLVTGDGHLPAVVAGVEAPQPEPLVIVLEPAARVSGRVVDADGGPVARARISLRGQAPPPGTVGVEIPRRENRQSATSDEEGKFTFEELVPGKVELRASAEGFQPSAPLGVEIPEAGSLEHLKLVLEPGAILEGRVSNIEEESVAEARIQVGLAGATSASDGFYRVEGIPPGRQSLMLRHPDYRSVFRWLEIEPGVNTADFVLRGGWPVAGVVMEESGIPVAEARVLLRGKAAGEPRRYQAISAADGGFRVLRVVPGSYDVEVQKEGYAPTVSENALRVAGGPVEGIELLLTSGTVLRGRILGLDFQQLARVRVEADRDERTAQPGTVDYQGRYEIVDLAPGDWRVRATLEGGSRQVEARLTIEPGVPEVERDFEFGHGLTLTGHVSYDGAALPDTNVTLSGHDVAIRRSLSTDHQGGFRFAELEPGGYRIELLNRREAINYLRDLELVEDRELFIDIATVQLRGTVVSATTSRPLAEARIEVQLLLDRARPGPIVSVATDPEGVFNLARLPAGRFRLTVHKDGYAPVERLLELTADSPAEDLQVSLAPTEGLELVIDLTGGRRIDFVTVSVLVDGRLLRAETRPLAEDGYVRFATVPQGTWNLLVSAPGAVAARITATVPGEPLFLTLADAAELRVRVPALLESGLIATLTVVGQDGRLFQGVELNGTPQSQWSLGAGTGVVKGIPAGVWTAIAVAPDGRSWRGTFAAAPGQELEVTLQ